MRSVISLMRCQFVPSSMRGAPAQPVLGASIPLAARGVSSTAGSHSPFKHIAKTLTGTDLTYYDLQGRSASFLLSGRSRSRNVHAELCSPEFEASSQFNLPVKLLGCEFICLGVLLPTVLAFFRSIEGQPPRDSPVFGPHSA